VDERAASNIAVVKELLGDAYEIVAERVLSNDASALQAELIDLCDREGTDLILTSGGIGVASSDRTPQATAAILDYEIPGIAEAIRVSAIRNNPSAMLARVLAGVRHKTLIVNLPGSPKALGESLGTIVSVLPDALEFIAREF
jgi:molybdenum cofactor synthesis domain-containing protein